MKKYIILILFFVFISIIKPTSIYAWDDCIFNKVNDEYPGDCARYIDSDNDNICDHSQSSPQDRIALETTGKGDIQEKENIVVKKETDKDYHLGLIAIVLFLSYGTSFLLIKFRKINMILHRKIWNGFLTLSFLITGILGILLVLKISHGVDINLPFEMIFWHVETGVVFTIISLFHIILHLSYYKRLFR